MPFFRSIECLLERLRKSGLTLVTAESLTGGMIGSALTRVPGASDVYWGGFVTYTVAAKVALLGIDEQCIRDYGVVSQEAARAMAVGALARSGADISIAVTGVAGPGGGTIEIPVGTVWIASSMRNNGRCESTIAERIVARGGRSSVRSTTVRAAVRLLLIQLDRG
jgi:nicotinamide-nucleotide amidase